MELTEIVGQQIKGWLFGYVVTEGIFHHLDKKRNDR